MIKNKINVSDELLKLRALEISDAKSIAFYANNKKIWKNLTDMFPHPYSLQDAVDFISSQKVCKPALILAIVYKGKAVGTIGFNSLEADVNHCRDFGFWLGEAFWNKGIMSLSVKEFIRYGFNTFSDTECIKAYVYRENTASARVLEKCGFKKVKMIKEAMPKAGEKKDAYLYKISR